MTAPVAPAVDVAPAAPTPAPEAPSYDGNVNISEMVQKASNDYETAHIVEGFQGRSVESITLDDIRALPGAQGMNDEQLQALWDEAKGTKQAPAPETPVAPAKPRAYKIMLDGKEVADVEALSAKDLLRAKVQYQANNKAQEKTWDEVVRNAQLGHYNAERTNQLTTERNNAFTQVRELTAKLTEADVRDRAIAKAFDAARREDYEPLKTLIEKYAESVDAEAEVPQGNTTTAEQQAAFARGQQVMENYVKPIAQNLATQFEGVTAEEIQTGIEMLIGREPAETFSAARLEQICNVEIPQYLQEMLDARASAPKVEDPRDKEIAELKAALAKQNTASAATQNARLDEVHARRRAAPAPLPAIPSSAATMEIPQINSAEDAMEFLKKFKG